MIWPTLGVFPPPMGPSIGSSRLNAIDHGTFPIRSLCHDAEARGGFLRRHGEKRPWNDTKIVGEKNQKKKRKESEHVELFFSTFVRLKKRVLTELESMFFCQT